MEVLESKKSPEPLYLTAPDCAARYGFSIRHWRRLVDAGKAPQPTRFGALVRWHLEALEAWEREGCLPIRIVKGVRR
jgi:predicted DNA-binding transcriptional regulator AlpA